MAFLVQALLVAVRCSLQSCQLSRDSKFTPAARYRVSCRNRERCEDGDAANEQVYFHFMHWCWHRWQCDSSKVIRELQQISLGKLSILRQGSRVFLLPLTCKQAKQWYSPFTKGVQIPDQVDFMDVSAASQEETLASAANFTSAWRMAAESWGFSVSVGIPIGSGTLSVGVGFEKGVTEMAERMNNFTKSLTSLKRRLSMYRLSFGNSGTAPLVVGSQMQLALDHLP